MTNKYRPFSFAKNGNKLFATVIVTFFVLASFSVVILMNESGDNSTNNISNEQHSSSLLGTSSYTLIFDATTNGGMCSVLSKIVNIDGTYGILPEATRTGYTFNGWFTSPTSETQVFSSTQVLDSDFDDYDRMLYAQFTDTPSTTELEQTLSDDVTVAVITLCIVISLIAMIAVVNIKK